THSWGGMMALRFIIVAFEASCDPEVLYCLSFFCMCKELGLQIGMFLSARPLSICFSGALAYGITVDMRVLRMFLVEGLPSIVMAGVAFFFVPDSPTTARFLDESDKTTSRAREVRQVDGDENSAARRISGIGWADIGAALLDPKVGSLDSYS
ncbi:hypothetical protein BJ875DRAFT_371050, partial [Amylocarpus encephaloides]